MERTARTANMGLAKWRVTCFYDTFVVKQTVVHLMNFCAEMPPLRQAQKRCVLCKQILPLYDIFTETNNKTLTTMAECVPFLQVRNIGQTIKWYEDIGFKCTATNHIWEPDCELNWARLEWDGAAFMLGPNWREPTSDIRDTSLWFNVEAIERIIETLKGKSVSINIEPETFYGRKVVSFRDINGFDVSFSCPITKT